MSFWLKSVKDNKNEFFSAASNAEKITSYIKEPYYPINNEQNNTLYNKYKELAASDSHVIFGGRLGSYKYMDMDKTIIEALKLVEGL